MSLDLNAEYPTFAEFEEDLKRYGATKYQTFIKRRSEKLKATHALFNSIRYKKLVYECVHHSKYKPEESGKREFLTSRKKGCTAEIRVNAHLRDRVLVIQTHHEVHNHQLSELVWKHLPENRCLGKDEREKVINDMKKLKKSKK